MDSSTPSDRLVVANWIEGELPDQLSCFQVQHADVTVGDQSLDRPVLVGTADADVMQPVVVAQGDGALGVDLVVGDAEVGRAFEGGLALMRPP